MPKKVYFKFQLSQEEAETLIDCIKEDINDLKDMINQHTPPDLYKWRQGRITYLEEISDKVCKGSKLKN